MIWTLFKGKGGGGEGVTQIQIVQGTLKKNDDPGSAYFAVTSREEVVAVSVQQGRKTVRVEEDEEVAR